MASFHKADKPATWLLIVANLLLPIALLTFATGFFPYKPFISGINEFHEADLESRPGAPFEKVIFMVVDALRRYLAAETHDAQVMIMYSDFVYSNNSGFSSAQRYEISMSEELY